MPTVSARPTSDILDNVSTAGIPAFSVQSDELGLVAGLKGSNVFAYMGRFELAIPDYATINWVRLTFTSSGSGVSDLFNRSFAVGCVDDDGIWPDNGFVSTSDYPNRTDVPWPWRYNTTSNVYVDNQGAWVGDSDPSDITFSIGPIATFDPYRWGEGVTPVEVSTPGVVSNFQAWLDGTGSTLRSSTASGTDLPVCFCVTPNDTGISWQLVYSGDTGTESNRPLLEVDYTEPSSGDIKAKSDVVQSVSARADVGQSVSAKVEVTPSVRSRTDVGVP